MKNRPLITIILIIAVTLVSLPLTLKQIQSKNPPPLQDITIQLKWVHQAQFAGIYMAQEKGFYAEEGLNAELIPFSFNSKTPIEKVDEGLVNFGVTGASELAIERANGVKVKAIATIYQLSPFALYSLQEENIHYPKDLEGKKIGIQTGTDGEYLFNLMLKQQNVNENSVVRIPIEYSADELIAGKTDASMGYIINEPYQAIEAGYKVNKMLMADYGPNIYGDILIASDKMINENPELVLKFLRATLKGWNYAIENPEETMPIILKYASDRTWAHEAYMLQESVPLIHTGMKPIGWMDSEQWSFVHQVIPDPDVREMMINSMDCHTTKFLEEIYKNS